MSPNDFMILPLACLGGKYAAKISPEDFERISAYKWSACIRTCGKSKGTIYAYRTYQIEPGNPKRRTVYLHREITLCPTGMVVDHRNHDTLDNRRANLRVCTPSQNAANKVLERPSPHGRGVKYRTNKDGKPYPRPYSASIDAKGLNGGKRLHLGYFRTAVEAAQAYDRAALAAFGEFAVLNFPVSSAINANSVISNNSVIPKLDSAVSVELKNAA